jgi:hypothetical protein
MAGRKDGLIGWGKGRDIAHGVTKQGSIIIPDGCSGSLPLIAFGSSFRPRDGADARFSFPPSHLGPAQFPSGQFPSAPWITSDIDRAPEDSKACVSRQIMRKSCF